MDRLNATIENIQSNENLNLVTFLFGSTQLTMVSLYLDSNVKIGSEVILNIKPTSIAIGKNIHGGLSYSNQLNTTIKTLELGELLCNIKLSYQKYILESIITKESATKMNLHIGESVTALIKANEISILEVLS